MAIFGKYKLPQVLRYLNKKVKFEQELRGGEEVSLSVGAMFQREVTVVQMKKPYNETILADSKEQQRTIIAKGGVVWAVIEEEDGEVKGG